MIYRYAILIAVVFFSCKNQKEKSINQSDSPTQDLKEKIVHTGDIKSYEELSTVYMDYRVGEFLPYALIMANKYDYPQAYYDVYESLTLMQSVGKENLNSVDSVTLQIALKYLKLSADKGSKVGKKILGQYYLEGKYFPKDTITGNELLREIK